MKSFYLHKWFLSLLLISSFSFVFGGGGGGLANDDPAGAISLTVNTSCTWTAGTNSGATASACTPDPACACFSSGSQEDVWYSFVAPAGGAVQIDSNTGTLLDCGMAVYSGTPCSSLTLLGCDDDASVNGAMPFLSLSGLTPGATYYIRFWEYCGDAVGTFSICVTQPPPPPANDNCAGAVSLTPGASCTYTSGTTAAATQSLAGCVGTANDDVWYSFVAANTTQVVNVQASASFDPVVQVYSGTCASPTSLTCNDASFPYGGSGSATVTGLTVGQTYWVRIYDYYTGTPTTSTFSVCITNPPTCPGSLGTGVTNIAALPYSATGQTTCGAVNDITGSNVANICGSSSYYGGEDKVYVFTPTTTGLVTITQSNTSGTVGMMLYQGCPFSGTCVANEQNSNTSKSFCVNVTSGTTYYLIIDSWPAPSCYTYDISISAPVTAPLGTSCTSNPHIIAALPFTANGLTTCCKGNEYTSADECASSYMDGEDYVFRYIPATNVTVDISLTGTLSSTGLFVTQNCPSAGPAVCVASATSGTGNPSLCGVALTAGNTYYIVVDTWPSPNCTPFNISVTSATVTSCNLTYSVANTTFNTTDSYTAGTGLNFPDDQFSPSYVPIGFTFCFDGIQYTQLLVSSNSYLIFDKYGCGFNLPASTNAAPAGYSAWSISGPVPNTTNAPRNCIMAPWHDINPAVSATTDIFYQTLGVAPNRRFVISFNNVPYFSCTTDLFKGQIKLFETTNEIEIHIDNQVICTGWNAGQAILGLHNLAGTIAVVPAGTNAPTQWSVNNTAWKFTPNCPTCNIILPLELLELSAEAVGSSNIISWKTSEKGNATYNVDRSHDGFEFETIGTVQAVEGQTSFTFADNHPFDELSYYKISESTKDGMNSSKTVLVQRGKKTFNSFDIYPNPSDGNNTVVSFSSFQKDDFIVTVYDLVGRKLFVKRVSLAAKENYKFDMSQEISLGKGSYIVELSGTRYKESKKLIIN